MERCVTDQVIAFAEVLTAPPLPESSERQSCGSDVTVVTYYADRPRVEVTQAGRGTVRRFVYRGTPDFDEAFEAWWGYLSRM